MQYPWELPSQTHTSQPPTAEIPRRQRTRAHAHRIQESLQTRVVMFLCSIFLFLLFLTGLILFILWISLRPHRPRFYVTSFSAPGVAAGSDSILASDITFTVLDRNPNRGIGIYYDALGGRLYYSDRRIGVTRLLAPFYQPPKNSTMMKGTFSGAALKVDERLQMGLRADMKGGRVSFRLELSARIRFKVNTWDTGNHAMHVNCEVAVGPDGSALPETLNERCSIYFG